VRVRPNVEGDKKKTEELKHRHQFKKERTQGAASQGFHSQTRLRYLVLNLEGRGLRCQERRRGFDKLRMDYLFVKKKCDQGIFTRRQASTKSRGTVE